MQLALAIIFILLLAAGAGVGIYMYVKSRKPNKAGKPLFQAPVDNPVSEAPPKPIQPPPTPKPTLPKPTQRPPLPKPAPPKPTAAPPSKPIIFATYIPAKPAPMPPPSKPPPPPPSKPPPPPSKPRTNCPKGKVPDPDNPSKLCKPSCRGVNLGYPYWGASGSCCASISNADCISWAQISKINDDKLAAEAERKRLIAEAEAERKRLIAEAEKKRLAAIEAEKKRLAAIEAEKKRLAAIEAEKKRQQEDERKRLADEAERKRLADEAKRQGCDDSLSIAFDTAAFLRAVNELRAGEGSKPLQWDAEAARAAVAWASRGYRTGIPHGVVPGCRGYPQNSYRLAEPEYKASLGASRYAVISSKFIDVARGMWGEKQFLSPFPGANCGTPGINDKVAWTIGHYCILQNPGYTRIGAGVGPSLDQNSDNSVVTFVIHAF